MADGGHVLAERDAERREDQHAARDRAAPVLHHHARSADALTAAVRIALPQAVAADAFARRDPALPVAALAGETMGTVWRILFARPRGTDPDGIARAVAARLAALVAEMSHWQPDSLLVRFNRLAAGRWMPLPPDFAAVMAAALEIAAASDGGYDPAIGALVDLWGHGPPGPAPVPDRHAVAAARDRSGWRMLGFDRGARRLRQPGGVALDLSGIAKGYAVDAVVALLAGMNIHDCLVEIGGELSGRGIRPDGEPWWVDLEVPPGTAVAPLRIALHGLAVATSGSAARGDHTLDPRTGHPIDNGVLSASVVASEAMAADAWATALTVLGPAAGMALAETRGIAARIVARAGGATAEYLSPALRAMLAD